MARMVRYSALCFGLAIAFLFANTQRVCAQTGPRDGSTPLALSPGAPAGSYALSGFETVNPYNGALTFHLPLLHIGGRGAAAASMIFSVQPKNWSVRRVAVSELVDPNGWEAIKPGYGPGILQGRAAGVEGNFFCPPTGRQSYVQTLTRLTFTSSDGTEYELRDRTLNGQPASPAVCNQGTARGRVFQTSDGSATTFISDATIVDAFEKPGPLQPPVRVILPSGFLLFRDGSRYRIDSGLVTWIRDRNGNLAKFFYDANKRVISITDSLNRVVSVTYANMTTTFFDEITYRGFPNGESRSIKVFYSDLDQCFRSDYPAPAKTYFELFALNSSQTTAYNPKKPRTVMLPNGRFYTLSYNYYGELARVKLPTGGAIEYDAVAGTGVIGDPDNGGRQIYRRVEKRRVYPNGGAGSNYEMLSTYSVATNPAVVDHYGPGQVLHVREKHYYTGDPAASLFQGPVGYPGWQDGKEFKTEIIASNGSQVLQQSDQLWQQRASVPWWTGSAQAEPPNDPRLVETSTTLPETGQVSKRSSINPQDGSVGFDRYNNPTDVWEYDYGAGAAGNLLRRTHTDYLETGNGVNYQTLNPNNSNPDLVATIHIRDLPVQQSTYDAGGVEKARTTYEYDNYATPLMDRPNISGHDIAISTSYLTRGNMSARVNLELASALSITTRMEYDIAGNVVSVTDPRNKTTMFDFDDRFGVPDTEARGNSQAPIELGVKTTYAFATKVTNPLGHTVYTQFDYYLGQPVNGEDSNQVVSKALYNDVLDRGTELVVAIGTPAQRRTTFSYDDAAKVITTQSDLANYNDGLLKSEVVYDGLGRTTDTRQYEDGPAFLQYILTRQNYDAMGRVYQVSNPYRPNASPAEPVLWTTTAYDALGRVLTVTAPDSSVTTRTYSGNATTVTDEAGKIRRSITDGIDRMIRVDEPTASGLGSVNSPNQPTSYTYDVLGNLTQASQGSQTRTFIYDSLSRLKQAVNPESDAINYTYDNNGNLETRTDARGVVTTLTYDALNRIETRIYSGPAPGGTTPAVTYVYDQATPPVPYSKGRMISVSSSVSTCSYAAYDPAGRLLSSSQTTLGPSGNQTYSMSYTYNIAGGMTSEKYPSNKVVVTEYDKAGRISGVKKDATTYYAGGASGSADAIAYTSHGAITKMKLGNGLLQQTSFNTRLLATQIQLGTGASPSSVLSLGYDYGPASTNNGNVKSQRIMLPGLDLTQNYDYDELNRLRTAAEVQTSGGAQMWTQSYDFDRWGNRAVNPSSTLVPNSLLTPRFLTDFNTSNNQIQKSGFGYDTAGNLRQDPATGPAPSNGMLYDGENHLISYTRTGETTTYAYDGNGRRVKKSDSTGTVVFVYNAGGQLIAEYSPAAQPNGTSYLTTDRLGSTRVVTSSSGSVKSRHDYLPFGEEIEAPNGGRAGGQGYIADNVRQRFTEKERDNESGFDCFLARYYSSAQGRFASADSVPGSKSNPQSLNLYAYVGNNPLRYVDPSGHMLSDIGVFRTDNPAAARAARYRSDPRYNEEQTSFVGQPAYSTPAEASNADSRSDPVPFVVSKVDELEKQVSAGTLGYLDEDGVAQCARLPLMWENDQEGFFSRIRPDIAGGVTIDNSARQNRLTRNWQMGDALAYGMNLQKGTVVATFDRSSGQYAQTGSAAGRENHTAVFLSWAEQDGLKGMQVAQQMAGFHGKAELGFIPFQAGNRYYRDAGRFNVVMIKK